jgi:hypothetical protein
MFLITLVGSQGLQHKRLECLQGAKPESYASLSFLSPRGGQVHCRDFVLIKSLVNLRRQDLG